MLPLQALALFATDSPTATQELESLWQDACQRYNAASIIHLDLPPLVSGATDVSVPSEDSHHRRKPAKRPSSRGSSSNGEAGSDDSDDETVPPRRRARRRSVLDEDDEVEELSQQPSSRSTRARRREEPEWVEDEDNSVDTDAVESEKVLAGDDMAEDSDNDDNDDNEEYDSDDEVADEGAWKPDVENSDMDDNDDNDDNDEVEHGIASKVGSRRRGRTARA